MVYPKTTFCSYICMEYGLKKDKRQKRDEEKETKERRVKDPFYHTPPKES